MRRIRRRLEAVVQEGRVRNRSGRGDRRHARRTQPTREPAGGRTQRARRSACCRICRCRFSRYRRLCADATRCCRTNRDVHARSLVRSQRSWAKCFPTVVQCPPCSRGAARQTSAPAEGNNATVSWGCIVAQQTKKTSPLVDTIASTRGKGQTLYLLRNEHLTTSWGAVKGNGYA